MREAEPEDLSGDLPDECVSDASPIDAIKALIEQAQAAAASESAMLKACGVIVASSLKSISLWGVIALFCAFVGLMAFAVGAIIALSQWTGAVWAMVIVPGALFLVAAIGVFQARASLRAMREAVDIVRS